MGNKVDLLILKVAGFVLILSVIYDFYMELYYYRTTKFKEKGL